MGIGIAVVIAIVVGITVKKFITSSANQGKAASYDMSKSEDKSGAVDDNLTSLESNYDYVYTDQTNHGIGPYGYVNRNEYETMLIGLGCEEGIDTDSAWRPDIDGNSNDSCDAYCGSDSSGGYDSGDSGDCE